MKRVMLLQDMLEFCDSGEVRSNVFGEVTVISESRGFTARCIRWLYLREHPEPFESLRMDVGTHKERRVYKRGEDDVLLWSLEVAPPWLEFEKELLGARFVSLRLKYIRDVIVSLKETTTTPKDLVEEIKKYY